MDHVINEKADKTDVKDVKAELKSVAEKLDQKADKTDVSALRDEVRSQFKGVTEKLDQKPTRQMKKEPL